MSLRFKDVTKCQLFSGQRQDPPWSPHPGAPSLFCTWPPIKLFSVSHSRWVGVITPNFMDQEIKAQRA